MKTYFIKDYDYTFTSEDVLTRLGMPKDHKFKKTIDAMIAKADPIAKPKAFFMEAAIEARTENSVTIGGQTFHSTALAKNFEGIETVYPFLCTCGKELSDYADTLTEIMEQYAFDVIMEFYLRRASLGLTEAISNHLVDDGSTSSVNPGSLVDWAITEQQELFQVFGENADTLGVSLSKSSLMNPVKSVSGIRYPSKEEFKNCQLCQRKDCPTREADFDEALYLKTLHE